MPRPVGVVQVVVPDGGPGVTTEYTIGDCLASLNTTRVPDILSALKAVLPSVRWKTDDEGVRATLLDLKLYIVDFEEMGFSCRAGQYRGFRLTTEEAVAFIVDSLHEYHRAIGKSLGEEAPPAPTAAPTLFAEAK